MSDQGKPQQAEDYFEKLAEFAQQQQDKVTELIEQSIKSMSDFKPFDVAEDVNEQVEKLVQSVNDELEQAMNKVNEQMKKLSQKTNK